MTDLARSSPLRYGAAAFAVLLATAARLALHPSLGNRQPFATLLVAVILAAWYGGLGPSLLALGLGAISGACFLVAPPGLPPALWVAALHGVGLYLAVGSAIVAFGEAGRAARRRLEAEVVERRRAEERLRFQAHLLDAVGKAVITTDPEGRVIHWNHAAETLYGWAAAETTGRGIMDRIVATESAGPAAEAMGLMRAGGTWSGDLVVRRRDGSTFPAIVTETPVFDDRGTLEAIIVVSTDITEQKRAEERWKESERRFARFMQHLPGLAWIKDMQGRYVFANDAAERAFGTPRPALYGRTDDEIFPPETAARFREHDRQALEAGTGVQVVETLEDEDGVLHHSLVSTFPIPGPDGEVGLVGGMAIDISERRRAEEALRESEGRFRGLMEQAPFSVQVLAPDGRTLRVNRAWEELWGVTLDQLPGYNILEDPQLEAKGVLDHIRRAFDGEPAVIPALQYDPNETIPDLTRHRDPRRWVSAVAYPLKDAAGRVREVVLVHDDITERKRAEESIRESEGRFRHLADAMPQIVWVTRPDRSVEYVNGRWLQYTGQTLEVALGPRGWALAVHPDDIGRIMEASVRSHTMGEPFEAEYRIKDACGAYRWHLGRAVPIFDEAGRVVRRFGAATDIDDRRRAEDSARFLAEASATLSALVDEAGTLEKVARLAVPIFADWCSVDMAGEDGLPRRLAVAHIDPAKLEFAHDLHRRYAPDPDALHGAPQVIRTGESQLIAEITDEMLVAGAKDDAHLAIIRDLGLRSFLCVPLKGRGGTLGAISFVAAESGRHYGPDDLRLAEDLASRAAIAIENARLYAELREADRRKNEFLATLAHELRNPLAPIRNALLLMRGRGGGEIEPDRAMAERQVIHLARLVDDLMDVARIKKGKIELRREVVELAPVVRHAVEAVRSKAEGRGHELIVSLPEAPIRLEADPTRLEQVIDNLLTNASKYTEPGGRITLEAGRDDGEAVIRVRDTGIGIPPEMLPHLFEMFAQVDGPSIRSEGGLGIGLGLAKSLVEMHGGAITAHSAGPGTGSEFVVRLPALPAAAPERAEPEQGSRDIAGASLPRRRILVVDDNADAASSLARLLTRLMGQEVRVAHDGPQALAAAREFRPDVVLLDIGMPGMDGYEVARRLRREPEYEGMRIVALSGWGQEADRRRSSESGIDRHLVKPVDPEVVRQFLADLRPPSESAVPRGG